MARVKINFARAKVSEYAKALVETMPKKESEFVTQAELVELLEKPIATLKERGYTYREIALQLSRVIGKEVNDNTLKGILSKINERRKVSLVSGNSLGPNA